jgi:rubrerythrin
MTSPKEYTHQVQECARQIQSSTLTFQERIKCIGISPSSLAEAKTVLAQLRNTQKQLRQIKRNINLDMKAIRAEYRQKSPDAAAFSSAFLTGLGKRKAAGKRRADAKRRLQAERDRKLAPYDSIKLAIDDLLVKMDGAKALFDDFIETAKVDLQAQKQTPKAQETVLREDASLNFCPQCGQAVVDQSDRFCRQCGHKLK